MVKNSLATTHGSLSLFQLMSKHRSAISGPPFYKSRDIFMYLELACHAKQKSFVLHPRIAE